MKIQTLPSVNCWKAFKLGFQNFIKFSGRSRRSDFFYFQISLGLIEYFALYAFLILFEEKEGSKWEYNLNEDGEKIIWIPILLILICLIPKISITVRRLHDIGKSGFNFFFSFIPIFGVVLLFSFCSVDSEQGANIYGPSPKYTMPPSENNYNPPIPGIPVNPYPKKNNLEIPASPEQQINPIPPEVISLPQPNIMPPEVMNNSQPNDINSKQNPIQPPVPAYSEQNPMISSDDIYSQ